MGTVKLELLGQRPPPPSGQLGAEHNSGGGETCSAPRMHFLLSQMQGMYQKSAEL